jgi:hypothetical protein
VKEEGKRDKEANKYADNIIQNKFQTDLYILLYFERR